MKPRGILYTTLVISVLAISIVYLTSSKPHTIVEEPKDVKVIPETEKQIVKSDDIVEEVIIGGNNDDVIGEQSDNYGPGMTEITETLVY
jgi:hypothetical protein